MEKSIGELQDDIGIAYRERNMLIALLSLLYPSRVYKDKDFENDNKKYIYRWVVSIELPTGQVAYHVHESDLHFFEHVNEGENNWDGHTREMKEDRLKKCWLKPQAGR